MTKIPMEKIIVMYGRLSLERDFLQEENVKLRQEMEALQNESKEKIKEV